MTDQNLTEKLDGKIEELTQAVKNAQEQSKHKNSELVEQATKLAEDINNINLEQKNINETVKGLEENIDSIQKHVSKKSDKLTDQDITEVAKEYTESFRKFINLETDPQTFAVNQEHQKEYGEYLLAKYNYNKNSKHYPDKLKTLFDAIGTQGGYVIPPQMLNQMINRIWETSPLRQYANVLPVFSNRTEQIIDDNLVDAYFNAEVEPADSVSKTANLGLRKIAVHTLRCTPQLSDEFMEDANIDVSSWLADKASTAMALKENKAFVSGDGNKQPKGFLTYKDYSQAQKDDPNGAYARNAIERVASQDPTSLKSDGLKALQNSLKESYQVNAIWGIRRKSFSDIITLKDEQGRYVFNTRFLQETRKLDLLGKDVVFMNDLPDFASGSLSVVYGDFKQGYTILDRVGIRLIIDNITSNGRYKYKFRKRVGGDVANFEALKLLETKA